MTNYVSHYQQDRAQDWQTPRDFFVALHDEYGFTMDGAATPNNTLLPRFSSEEAPRSWVGERVFCNPPWGNIRPFIEQAATAHFACLLVPARVNSRWFHRALALGGRPRFFLSRPRFEGRPGNNSPVDCVLLLFGL